MLVSHEKFVSIIFAPLYIHNEAFLWLFPIFILFFSDLIMRFLVWTFVFYGSIFMLFINSESFQQVFSIYIYVHIYIFLWIPSYLPNIKLQELECLMLSRESLKPFSFLSLSPLCVLFCIVSTTVSSSSPIFIFCSV